MFTKLTRINGSPVWLNASFVVTIEPGRQGGSIVVPIGDGLDYEVRETPAQVLSLLGDAPAPEVIPVPVVNTLAKLPTDVVPEGGLLPNAKQLAQESEVKPEEKTSETPAVAKTRGRKSASTTKKTPRTRAKASKKPILDLTEEQVERLRKMAPGSVKKLQNTLLTQFRVPNAEATVTALVAHDVALTDEHGRVLWKQKPQPSEP